MAPAGARPELKLAGVSAPRRREPIWAGMVNGCRSAAGDVAMQSRRGKRFKPVSSNWELTIVIKVNGYRSATGNAAVQARRGKGFKPVSADWEMTIESHEVRATLPCELCGKGFKEINYHIQFAAATRMHTSPTPHSKCQNGKSPTLNFPF